MNANQKTAAAQAAVEYVKDGMRLGIGTGSTAEEFIKLLAARVREGLTVRCVATSARTERICAEQGVEILPLNELPHLDLTIDGADEIDPQLSLIKGGGGALLREKIVAAASDRMIVIADSGKLVDCLGRFPLPVEVVPFGLESTRLAMLAAIADIGAAAEIDLRRIDGKEFVTDSGNWILDASFGRIPDAFALAGEFANIPGVVEHGLFLGMADLALIGEETGVRKLQAKAGPS